MVARAGHNHSAWERDGTSPSSTVLCSLIVREQAADDVHSRGNDEVAPGP